MSLSSVLFFFFFNDTATTEIYTLSLHDALPILVCERGFSFGYNNLVADMRSLAVMRATGCPVVFDARSEEHTSELQSPDHLVCRLLLEKKKYCIEFRSTCRHCTR